MGGRPEETRDTGKMKTGGKIAQGRFECQIRIAIRRGKVPPEADGDSPERLFPIHFLCNWQGFYTALTVSRDYPRLSTQTPQGGRCGFF